MDFQNKRFSTLRRIANRLVAAAEFAKLSAVSLFSEEPDCVVRLAVLVPALVSRGDPGPRRLLLLLVLLVALEPVDEELVVDEFVGADAAPVAPDPVAVPVFSAAAELVVLDSGSINTTSNTE